MKEGLKSQKPNENDDEKEIDPVVPDELLQDLPPEERRELMQSITHISGVFPQQNPILKRITSEHLTILINNENETDKRDREERQGERNHNYKILVMVLVAVMLLCGLFIWAEQLDFLKYLIGAIFGFGGGFGVGTRYRPKE